MTGWAALAGLAAADGTARLTLDARHVGAPPVAHGGIAMSLIEAACASLAGAGAAALSLKVQLVGPARLGETITATARVTRRTRTLVFLEAVADTPDREIARASAVYEVPYDV